MQLNDKLKKRLIAAAIASVLALLAHYGVNINVDPDGLAEDIVEESK